MSNAETKSDWLKNIEVIEAVYADRSTLIPLPKSLSQRRESNPSERELSEPVDV
jgi:hypothetical protein